MAITMITQFKIDPSDLESILQQATITLKAVDSPPPYVLGPQVQDRSIIHLLYNPSAGHDLTTVLVPILDPPNLSLSLHLDKNPFDEDEAAHLPILEVVHGYFPSTLPTFTPDFQRDVEADFAQFVDLMRTNPKWSDRHMSVGWSAEVEVEGVEGGKAKVWFVAKGWNSVEDFEVSIKDEVFERALPGLLKWGVKVDLVHVEKRVAGGF